MIKYILQPSLFENGWTLDEAIMGDDDKLAYIHIAEISFDREGRLTAQAPRFCMTAALEDTLDQFAIRLIEHAHTLPVATGKAVKAKDETLDMFA